MDCFYSHFVKCYRFVLYVFYVHFLFCPPVICCPTLAVFFFFFLIPFLCTYCRFAVCGTLRFLYSSLYINKIVLSCQSLISNIFSMPCILYSPHNCCCFWYHICLWMISAFTGELFHLSFSCFYVAFCFLLREAPLAFVSKLFWWHCWVGTCPGEKMATSRRAHANEYFPELSPAMSLSPQQAIASPLPPPPQ